MKSFLYGCLATVIIGTASCSKDKGSSPAPPPPPVDTTPVVQVSAYLTKARQTHDFIIQNLLTTYGSYRVNTTTNTGSALSGIT